MASFSDAERYDRQIRVWGAEAQTRLQHARVLICYLTNLNVEVVKNLVLAGVQVTLLDPHPVTVDDLVNNFFLTVEDIGKNVIEAALPRIEQLNKHINLQYKAHEQIADLPDSYFEQFDVFSISGGNEVMIVSLCILCEEFTILKNSIIILVLVIGGCPAFERYR